MPAVTVAIPTLSAGPVLEACLIALAGQNFRDFEVIIVNNGDKRNTISIPFGSVPIRVLSPGRNVGFGAAINLAFRASESPLIATLNDDTEPDPGWLNALVCELAAHPEAGMCASRVRLHPGDRLDSAGMLICRDGSSKQRGGSEPPSSYGNSSDALLPSACAALYRRGLFRDIGLFSEEFFLYCEDTDLGLRARWAGWGCRYAASATVLHRYSHTARAYSPLKARFVERNRLWVAIRNFPAPVLAALPFTSLLRYLWQVRAVQQNRGAAAEFVKTGQSLPSAFRILLWAHFETLRRLPELLAERAEIRRTRKVSVAEFRRLLKANRISCRNLAYT